MKFFIHSELFTKIFVFSRKKVEQREKKMNETKASPDIDFWKSQLKNLALFSSKRNNLSDVELFKVAARKYFL